MPNPFLHLSPFFHRSTHPKRAVSFSMANLPNAGAPVGSLSSVDGKYRTSLSRVTPHTDGDGFLDIENLLAHLSITQEGAREIVRALVILANSVTVPGGGDRVSNNSVIAASPTVTTEAYNATGDDVVDDDNLSDTSVASVISLSDLGSGGNLTPARSSTLVAATPLNVASMLPAITVAPVSAPAAAAPAAGPAAVIPALPLYNALPVNTPANAVLPPVHLIALPYGYHVPAANAEGPFYVVTRGRNIGVFNGW